jgi:branched-chain amino acid transport system ATP-binding protein
LSAQLLELEAISKRFRGLKAVDQVSFSVPRGAIIGLIGPNGAGKTTIFNMIAGVLAPDAGRIRLDGKDITGYRPDAACRAGIGRTFQLVRPFAALTVLENVVIGAFRLKRSLAEAERHATEILERLGLAARAHDEARSLTLADRKRLETARALATGPKLLLLDEVMAGLRPVEIDRMVETFTALVRDTGLTILLTEHVMRAVMALSHHIVVLHHGRKICEGEPETVARDPAVLDSYLGAAVL